MQKENVVAKKRLSGSHLTYKEILNKTHRLGLGPTGAASKPENICSKAGKLSGHALTYKGESLNKNFFTAPLRHGFTLIELLVVILIIGILAAVAVPQYQKAVEKARMTEALTNMATLEKATDLFLLENPSFSGDIQPCGNGVYSQDLLEAWEQKGKSILAELDVLSFQGAKDGECWTKNFYYLPSSPCPSCGYEIDRTQESGVLNYLHYYMYTTRNATTGKWHRECSYVDDLGEKLCKQLQQQGWSISDER